MPHVNGYELCQQIKNASDPRLVLTPLILMSGFCTRPIVTHLHLC
jgi:response regulator RpfG family c-di-GMP phosphodiesterase